VVDLLPHPGEVLIVLCSHGERDPACNLLSKSGGWLISKNKVETTAAFLLGLGLLLAVAQAA
jgi:hypothetical protein